MSTLMKIEEVSKSKLREVWSVEDFQGRRSQAEKAVRRLRDKAGIALERAEAAAVSLSGIGGPSAMSIVGRCG